MTATQKIFNAIESKKTRSAWSNGVKNYALDLVEQLTESINGGWFDAEDIRNPRLLEKALLNGASDWSQYSWGGCAYCYNWQIAEALCNASELKRTDGGRKKPNASEEWLDVQARALYQACDLIKRTVAEVIA